MTTIGLAQDVSLRAALFDSQEDAIGAVTAWISSGEVADKVRDALREVPSVTKNIALGKLGGAAAKLLELDLTDILAAGWRKHMKLLDVARRTAKDRSEEPANLASHKISLAHEPSISILLNATTVTTINFRLEAEFEIAALTATIRSGYLTAIGAGACKVHGTLAVEGSTIVNGSKTFELPGIIRIRNGIPLLHGPELPGLLPAPEDPT